VIDQRSLKDLERMGLVRLVPSANPRLTGDPSKGVTALEAGAADIAAMNRSCGGAPAKTWQ